MRFKIVPKTFPMPEAPNTGVTISEIEMLLKQTSIPASSYPVIFVLYKPDGSQYGSVIEYAMPAAIEVPGILQPVPTISGLTSSTINDVYQVASIVAGVFQYELLPIAQQEDLQTMFLPPQ